MGKEKGDILEGQTATCVGPFLTLFLNGRREMEKGSGEVPMVIFI